MNIQIFNIGEQDRTVAIDMEKVKAIYDASARTFNKQNGIPIYKIDAFLDIGDGTDNDFKVCVCMNHDELKEQMAFQGAQVDENGHSLFEYTDMQAMALMCRYWKDLQDTPLTKAILRKEKPQQTEDQPEADDPPAAPNICKKLRVGLYKGDGMLMFEEIVYPGFMEDLTFEEFDMLGQKIDFATVDDPEHPNMIVTDDIAFLAERMCQEWGESYGQHGETYVAKVLDSMVSGIITADRIHIDGNIFNAADGQYIVVERYKKDIEYTDRTKEFMKQIGKELKK